MKHKIIYIKYHDLIEYYVLPVSPRIRYKAGILVHETSDFYMICNDVSGCMAFEDVEVIPKAAVEEAIVYGEVFIE